jgi:mono/diheme cytochrome c family protein
MKTATFTFLMTATLTFALAARADEAAKPAAPAGKAAPAASTTKPAVKAENPGAPPAAVAIPEKAKIDWDKMSKNERKKYMKTAVLPAAKKMFAAYDAKKYSKVTCATCHGPGATDGTFKMPNPELPKLPKSPAGFKELADKKPEMMKFMGQTVKPTVAALLGEEQWSPENPKGFGCIACHENMK